jgi:hypothetical protein
MCSPAPRSTTWRQSSISGRCAFAESARSSASLRTAAVAMRRSWRIGSSTAARNGAVMTLRFSEGRQEHLELSDFEAISIADAELAVTESPRRGAPMTLIRGGEERDLAAIAAMGQVRASPFRFHLDRDVDFVQYAITKKRLLAGLGEAGARSRDGSCPRPRVWFRRPYSEARRTTCLGKGRGVAGEHASPARTDEAVSRIQSRVIAAAADHGRGTTNRSCPI